SLVGLDSLYSFFFQAEDGIRDLYVTGVQTCALPISGERVDHAPANLVVSDDEDGEIDAGPRPGDLGMQRVVRALTGAEELEGVRSEERRVGKECRARWGPYC